MSAKFYKIDTNINEFNHHGAMENYNPCLQIVQDDHFDGEEDKLIPKTLFSKIFNKHLFEIYNIINLTFNTLDSIEFV